MGGPCRPADRPSSTPPAPGGLARAGTRAAVAAVVLAAIWAVAFGVQVLPFFPTIVVGGILTGLAGLWVRRGVRGFDPRTGARRPFPTFRVTPPQAGLAVAVAVVHLGAGHLLFVIGQRVLPGLTETAAEVYGRAGTVPLWLAILLGGVITGPLEEIFWRGAVQPLVASRIDRRLPRLAGLPFGTLLGATLLYTLFHVATGHLALVAAAALGGLVWGWLLLRTGSVGATMIAHGLWTAGMLVFPPVG